MRQRRVAWIVRALGWCLIVVGVGSPARGGEIDAWRVITADGVEASLHEDQGQNGPCLRLDYHFRLGSGYCLIEREMPRDLPGDFEFSFMVRGEGPSNNFECKLLDIRPREGGEPGENAPENVWWVNKRAYEFPREWTRVRYKRRHFEFAWGPSPTARIERLSRFHFGVAASTGGTGRVWIEGLTFRDVPPPPSPTPTPVTTGGGDQPLVIDLGFEREIGGLWAHFDPRDPRDEIVTLRVFTSDDASAWTLARRDQGPFASRRLIPLPDVQCRYLRIEGEGGLRASNAEVIEPEATATRNAMLATLAKENKGKFPAMFQNILTYWTVVGLPESAREALLDEHGRVEVDKGGWTLEPVILAGGEEIGWEGANHEQTLAEGSLPVATVLRTSTNTKSRLALRVTPVLERAAGREHLRVEYTLSHDQKSPVRGVLRLLARPYQVNPPSQFLNTTGGTSSVVEISRDGDTIVIDGRDRVACDAPATLRASTFAMLDLARGPGDEARALREGEHVRCPDALAEGVLDIPFEVHAGTAWTVSAIVERSGEAPLPALADISGVNAVTNLWREKLSRVDVQFPGEGQEIAESLKAQLGYILVNRDGPAIQPGSRSYERSWIRDGCLTSSALLSFGFTDEARAFVDWYGEHLFESGKVPCVVDSRGPDPVPENDSHGQYIYAVWNLYAHTGDTMFLRRHWPRVKNAVAYIRELRATRLTPEFESTTTTRREPGKPAVPLRAFRGLVPESISHEGYSAKPMHSYWDDAFTLKGLRDAARLSQLLNDPDAPAYATLADEFQTDLLASLDLAMKAHAIDYLPGCVELGDFDSTSTTVGVWPCNLVGVLPDTALHATFDRYWTEFEKRRESDSWEAYTPYEWRHVGALVRMGQRDRADAALRWYQSHQRPRGWRHWAEVVWRNPTTPRFIGDMPHTWCGSDFVNSVRSMLVYEEESSPGVETRLVLFAGVPRGWAKEDAMISFRDIHTHFGPISASARHDGATWDVLVSSSGRCDPPDGIVVNLPRAASSQPPALRVNGVGVRGEPDGTVVIRSFPQNVRDQE